MLYKAQAEINALIAEAEAETKELHVLHVQPEGNTTNPVRNDHVICPYGRIVNVLSSVA